MRIKSLLLISTILASCFVYSLPNVRAQPDIIEFPALSGPYQVGRAKFDMIDHERAEIFTANETDVREFTITVFYPAIPDANADRAAYVEAELLSAFEEYTGVPASIWQTVHPHAYAHAPVADGVFPIILFSHGSGTPLTAYTGLMEDLASNGYIIVGISHTYDTPAVALSDGRIFTPAQADGGSDGEEDEMLLSTSLADMLFVLDQLHALNTTSELLAGHMDLTRVGAMGHSFGGTTALQGAYQDARILAVVNLDGSIYGDVRQNGLNRPTMIMAQDLSLFGEAGIPVEIVDEFDGQETVTTSLDSNTDELIQEYIRARETVLRNATPGYDLVLRGASHDTYVTDVLVLAEAMPIFAEPELIGTLDDLSIARAGIHNTTLAFFNTYVAQANSPHIDDLAFEGFEVTVFNKE